MPIPHKARAAGLPSVVIFDCDGVLLDSNLMKSDAFRETLESYDPVTVDRFIAYQKRSFGRSRYRLYGDFFADFLSRPAAQGEVETLLDRFGAACRTQYLRVAETPAMRATLQTLLDAGCRLHVASGSDEAELRDVLEARGLAVCFVSVRGSPTPKADLLTAIVAQEKTRDAVFVGDSSTDLTAAQAAGLRFIHMKRYCLEQADMDDRAAALGFSVIDDLSELVAVLTPHTDKVSTRVS
jgi:phosphoglycolate phosphatase-like HAD superfamily hydrolase